jgi:hypothetical protein
MINVRTLQNYLRVDYWDCISLEMSNLPRTKICGVIDAFFVQKMQCQLLKRLLIFEVGEHAE